MRNDTTGAVSAGADTAMVKRDNAPAGWGELFSGKNGIYALTLAGGVTLHAVNMYIATTVMPSVIVEIGGLDFYAWTTTLFVIASILGAALICFGIGLAWSGLVTRVYQSAPATEQDLASGGMTTVQLFAIAFGTACAGMIANFAGISDAGDVAGASNASLWLAGLFAAAPVLAIFVAMKVVRLTGGKG